tara:strand:+ start:6760 stop:8886 length:2127 start_codon:yes stop_codon:yes gene_type:complete
MKTLIQKFSNGKIDLIDAPLPSIKTGHLLIETAKTLISSGTEGMLVDFGRSNIVNKALKQPERVKQVLDKISSDGLIPTIDAVRSKFDDPVMLGYSNVGIVREVGKDVEGFKIGDRVVSNGPHSEYVVIPKNLCAKVPSKVSDDEATFTVLGSIALQSVRLSKPNIGESVAVIGTGLIGLLVVQILLANGCKVLAIDIDESNLEQARKYGAQTCNPSKGENPEKIAKNISDDFGVDSVIIAASTDSNEPIETASKICRQRGNIVLVGVSKLDIKRELFYEKELSFQVSCSYGPGRYDESYETKGNDYPIGFVRWTENRNFQAFLDLIESRKIDTNNLVSKIFNFEDASDAYDYVVNKKSLGVLLNYSESKNNSKIVRVNELQKNFDASFPVLGVFGAGNYASRVLLPAFKKTNVLFNTISSSSGVSSSIIAKKFGFLDACSDNDLIFKNPDINTIIIATRHNSHFKLIKDSLINGKNVFVEKPLAIEEEHVNELANIYKDLQGKDYRPRLMVGFNRRFSPYVKKIKELIKNNTKPKTILMTINSGEIPSDHWTQDKAVGGGRIIGEVCHFVDLARHIIGSNITDHSVCSVKNSSLKEIDDDKSTINLNFADGSMASINYFANGSKSFPKERIEVFSDNSILQLNNFTSLVGYGVKGFKKISSMRQDKGQEACVKCFVKSITDGTDAPIPADEIFEVSSKTIAIANKLS